MTTPNPGERWTRKGHAYFTFVGVHPRHPSIGVWVTEGDNLVQFTWSDMYRVRVFDFKPGDILKNSDYPKALWVVIDPTPDDPFTFRGRFIHPTEGPDNEPSLFTKNSDWSLA